MGVQGIAAWVAAVILFLFVGLQLLLAAGSPFGRLTWGGTQPARLSDRMRVVSAVAAFVLAIFAVTVLARADVVSWFIAPGTTRLLTWVVVALLALDTAGSLASRSVAERRVMGPLAGVALVATLVVTLGR